MDTQKSDEAQSGTFETIEPDQDNPVKKEFEIGELGNEELKEDEMTRNETDGGAPGNYKPSQRKF
jgi:DNA-binding PadR family transcriptional regulator